MKKKFMVFACALLIAGFLLGTMQSPAQAKALVLKYASMNPTTAWIHPHWYLPWAKQIEDVTEGRVKVKIYPAQTLGKATEFFDLVKSGIADVGLGCQVFTPGQYPLTDLLSLPFLPIPSAEVSSRIMWDLYEKFPEVRKEYPGIKMLHFGSTDSYFLVTRSQKVATLADLKGLKLRSPGGRGAEALKALGATPVAVPMPELYLSLEKGVLDGAPIPGEAYMGQVPQEKLKFALMEARLWVVPFWIGINEKTWSKISQKDQDAIMSICGGDGSAAFGKDTFDSARGAALERMKELKVDVTFIAPEERAKWVEMTKHIHTDYIKQLEEQGLPGQAVYDEIGKLLEKYSK